LDEKIGYTLDTVNCDFFMSGRECLSTKVLPTSIYHEWYRRTILDSDSLNMKCVVIILTLL